jgi:nitrite reductase/ring-hydroxylating ferredoxin subunit
VNDRFSLHTKQQAYRTFVIGARVPRESTTMALYWDTEHPYHYARLVRRAKSEQDVVIVGGEDHRTGQPQDAAERFNRLESWSRERFPAMGPIEYRWSGQVMEPVDALAYIGRNPGDQNVWVVTGDSGNGMTHGAIAGMLIRDLILGRENDWAKLYDPSRKSVRAALDYTKGALATAAQYKDWMTGGDVRSEEEIPKGSGAIVRHGLHKHAVYRCPNGTVHRLSAVCPHLGAIVRWNAEECTWDCPAHGSRFDAEGKVLNGPANTGLRPAESEAAHEPQTTPTRGTEP